MNRLALSRYGLPLAMVAVAGLAACESSEPVNATPEARPVATSTAASSASAPAPSGSAPVAATASAAPTAPMASSRLAIDPGEPAGDAARGKALVAKMECHRCHDGAGHAPIKLTSHCVHCHQKVMADGFKTKPDNARWKKNVAHLTAVPNLAGLGDRAGYPWVVAFLMQPHDLRPNLVSTMPRLALTREQARDIATHLTAGASDAPKTEPGDAARGRALLDAKACTTCHTFTGVPPFETNVAVAPRKETRPAMMLAPDLSEIRGRMDRDRLVRWLLDPKKLKPDTLMPQTPMSEQEARDIASYVLTTPLERVTHALPARLPLLKRKVTYEEVAKKVLDVTCRHCHGNPDDAIGDGGPGNTGGFGFKPRRLNLSSYRDVQGGYVDDAGDRHSVFAKTSDGTPRLIASLYARQAEEAGAPLGEVRGMPLGLPPLTPEQIQLLASWVDQGRPR